ncbi:MAG: FAD-binding protein [Rhodocyclaceae bacterium]|nr:FAD-binding protein [Rhodocyclaceae bacterium]MBL0074799.1 FAD-binding protein [Rhodocyclaceae bacterium]MBP6110051.1 FAD-binding protein [Rhodocyclaceae bacterium]MBP6278785.1 FAD-binding protein [Rhodocyclaceae bacterium]
MSIQTPAEGADTFPLPSRESDRGRGGENQTNSPVGADDTLLCVTTDIDTALAHSAEQDQNFASIHHATLFSRLKKILPQGALLQVKEDLAPYECDGLSAYRRIPLAVALPEDEAQVVAVMKACYEAGVPVVARGAGTGLSGGAMPHEQGLVLSLAKLKRIVRIDKYSRTAVVQPGVRNLAISEAAAPFGLYYAPDPSSQIACSIGGNVAENSGGVHCLKYGLTVHNVLRVRVVLADGDVVTLGSEALDSAGLDLLALFIGSEGLLGIATEVTVKLTPKPQFAQCILASFDDVRRAGDAVAAVIAAGIIPAGLEMMDQPATRAVEPFVKAGYDINAAAILLCESDGTKEEVGDEIARMKAVLEGCGATEIRVSQSEAERILFWAGRKAAFPAAGRVSPDYYCMDGTIPKRRLADMLIAITELEKKYGLRCMNVFHAGDGNLHPLILYDANVPGELERTEAFGAEILKLSVDFGGTITGEHGVGFEKINAMCEQFASDELRIFHGIKAAWDARGLLNPGKAVPSLHRCAEFGRMHVHGGQTAFPEIERL